MEFTASNEKHSGEITRPSMDSESYFLLPYGRPELRRDKRLGTLRFLYLSLAANILLGTTLLAVGVAYLQLRSHESLEGILYSPANVAIERQDIIPHPALNDDGSSPYMGYPNAQNARAWYDLYNYIGVSRISTDEARPLLSRTLPIPGDDGHYTVQLAVFHQLHCLNHLRIKAWDSCSLGGDRTDDAGERTDPHLDHCIQVLRQAIMCHGDVTPLSLGRDPTNTIDVRAKWIMASVHTCRNFDRIHEWGERHKLVMPLDVYTVVKDDPLGWGDKPTENYKFAVPVPWHSKSDSAASISTSEDDARIVES